MKIDKASETWAYIADFCKKKIEEETRAIMHIDCDARRADNARGAIAAHPTTSSPSYASTPGAGSCLQSPRTNSPRSGPRRARCCFDGIR